MIHQKLINEQTFIVYNYKYKYKSIGIYVRFSIISLWYIICLLQFIDIQKFNIISKNIQHNSLWYIISLLEHRDLYANSDIHDFSPTYITNIIYIEMK